MTTEATNRLEGNGADTVDATPPPTIEQLKASNERAAAEEIQAILQRHKCVLIAKIEVTPEGRTVAAPRIQSAE